MTNDPRAIPRLDARRLARGDGRYIDDLDDADALHAVFARSPVAHGVLRGVGLERARRAPGVAAAYALADLAQLGGRAIPIGWMVPGQRPGDTPLLAGDRVRYVGEPVAVVVAATRALAEDAVELVDLDLEPLPPIVELDDALRPDAVLLYPEWGDNVLARETFGGGSPTEAFAGAQVVVGGSFEIARQTGVPMECRGALARYDAGGDEVTVHSSTQSPHHAAEHLAHALGRRVRVIAPDVGGSFGVKDHACVEEAVIALAAVALRRPVKWLQNRSEHLVSGVHSRGQRLDLELAADGDGRIRGVRGRVLLDAGARSGNHGVGTGVYAALILPGPYDIAAVELELLGVVTNKPPSAAYRGYGAPEAVFAMEGLVDQLARELDLPPVDVRRRNLIAAASYPYRSATGCVYDGGDPRRALDRAVELSQAAREALPPPADGRRRGTGIASFVLMSGFGPTRAALDAGMSFGGYESARVRMDADARVTVAIGMPTQGQGVETGLAQVAASALGVDARTAVRMDSADTQRVPYSPVGAIASRGAVVGGAAVLAASERLARQLRRMAGRLLDVPPESIALERGQAVAVDGGSAMTLAAVARALRRGELEMQDGELLLEGAATIDPATETFSYGTHVAVVDVDPATGETAVVHYAAVTDCGRMINPAIVHGQIEGGIVAGIGGALMEELAFDTAGRPLATTLFDYVIPSAADVPPLVLEMIESPSQVSPTGARGAGEAGILGPAAALAGATADALGAAVGPRRVPLTPPRVLALAGAASMV